MTLLFSKPQEKRLEKTSLLEKDFVLAIQTSLQVDVLQNLWPRQSNLH